MTGKRNKAEDQAQIKVLREEGYNIRQIATRLKLASTSVAKSFNNFKSIGRYGYEKPKGRPKCTIKRMDDAIILSAKKSPRKTSKAIHAALPQDTATARALPRLRTIRRKLFRANLKSYKPTKKLKLSPKNIADRLAFCNKYQAWTPEQWKRAMFSNESQISQFYAFYRHVQRPPNNRELTSIHHSHSEECCKSYDMGGYLCKWKVWFVVHARWNFHQWNSALECVEGKVTKLNGNISL